MRGRNKWGRPLLLLIAAITTLSGLEGSIGDARSATFEPANSTRSSSIRSAPPCCDRTCSRPARPQYQRGGRQEATNACRSLPDLDRKIDAVATERRRLADLYQASFIEREELLAPRHGVEIYEAARSSGHRNQALINQRVELATAEAELPDRVEGFARRVQPAIDRLDFAQRQKLLRLVIDEVRVSGWLVEIRFRIPLGYAPLSLQTHECHQNRLRSLHINEWGQLPAGDQQTSSTTGRARR